MDYSKILKPVIKILPERQASYINRLLFDIEADPRFAEGQNLLYALLARVAAGLPPELDRLVIRNELAIFFAAERTNLAQAVYDPSYVLHGGRVLDPLAEKFLSRIVDICFALAAQGQIGDVDRKVWRFAEEEAPLAFPYDDENEGGL